MKYLLTISLAAILALLFFIQKGCKDVANLQSANEQSKHKSDSLGRIQNALIDSNYKLNIDLGLKDIEFNRQRDSFTTVINEGKNNLKFLDSRIKNLISTIRDYGTVAKDSSVVSQSDSLQELYNLAKDNVNFLLMTYDAKDSSAYAHIAYLDSVIVMKDTTIARLNKNYQSSQALIIDLQAAVDKAIKQGKRKNIIRTIAEAVLVAALLFKK